MPNSQEAYSLRKSLRTIGWKFPEILLPNRQVDLQKVVAVTNTLSLPTGILLKNMYRVPFHPAYDFPRGLSEDDDRQQR